MRDLGRAISAELLKVKRTLAFWMVFVAPLVVVTLQFLMLWQRSGAHKRMVVDAWPLVITGTYSFYAIGMLPLFITLETALLAGIEHSQKSWKQLFALPVSRGTIMTAKIVVAAAMIGASCVVLLFATVAAGYALSALVPTATFASQPPWGLLWSGIGRMFIASWLILALHSWIALRWSSFALASGFGMAATVGIALIANSERWWKIYPWALPVHASVVTTSGQLAMTLGVAGGLIVAVLGCWDVARRDVL
jgi:hypothetical protein